MTDFQSLIHNARHLRDQGHFQEAYKYLQQLDWLEASSEFYLLKGALERQLGLIGEAMSSLAIALSHGPHHGFACYELGELARSRGLPDDAVSWFLAALRSAPRHHWIHNSLQYTHFNDDRLPQVAAEYEQHCHSYPDDKLALHLLAQWQIRLGRTEAAINTSRRAARLGLGPQETWLASEEQESSPPDFIIIGVPKGGTTSLLNWLGQHPKIWSHPRKELHFFNGAWEQGKRWYLAQFPQFQNNSGIIRGEATPQYFLTPNASTRILQVAPKARIIVLLRDPLQRAISWIEHLRRFEGLEGSTEALLLQELQLLQSNPDLIQAGCSPHHLTPQALLGSCYDPVLEHWQKNHKNSILVLRSEDLFEHPKATLETCAAFLGVGPESMPQTFAPLNVNAVPHHPVSKNARILL